MGNEERKHLAVKQSPDHQDVTGAEIVLAFLVHGEGDGRGIEVKRDGLALFYREIFRSVEQCHIDASSVRSVVMHYLVVRRLDFRLVHQVFQNMAVLHLAESEHCMICLVLISHSSDDGSDIMEFLLVFRLGPLVLAVRKKFVVVLPVVMVSVEKVLDIVKAQYVAFRAARTCRCRHRHQHKRQDYVKYSFHYQCFCVIAF